MNLCSTPPLIHFLNMQVTKFSRRTEAGFLLGSVTLTNFSSGREVEVVFKNENVVAILKGEKEEIIASVPHLIINMETDSGRVVQTEDLRLGQRLSTVVIPAPPELLWPESLKVMGPEAFGYPEIKEPII